jgi:hypothetical protein
MPPSEKMSTRADRWSVASRTVAAVVGGYAFTSLLVIAISVLLPRFGIDQAETLFAATMASFLIYAVAIMAVFQARTATRAWMGLLLFSIAPAIIVSVFAGPGAG